MTKFKIDLLIEVDTEKQLDKILTDALCARGFHWEIKKITNEDSISCSEALKDLSNSEQVELDMILREGIY